MDSSRDIEKAQNFYKMLMHLTPDLALIGGFGKRNLLIALYKPAYRQEHLLIKNLLVKTIRYLSIRS